MQQNPGALGHGVPADMVVCIAGAEGVSIRLDAVPLEKSWTLERAERWCATHRPADQRLVADVLLSQEGGSSGLGRR
jgi:hypothetical protein